MAKTGNSPLCRSAPRGTAVVHRRAAATATARAGRSARGFCAGRRAATAVVMANHGGDGGDAGTGF